MLLVCCICCLHVVGHVGCMFHMLLICCEPHGFVPSIEAEVKAEVKAREKSLPSPRRYLTDGLKTWCHEIDAHIYFMDYVRIPNSVEVEDEYGCTTHCGPPNCLRAKKLRATANAYFLFNHLGGYYNHLIYIHMYIYIYICIYIYIYIYRER